MNYLKASPRMRNKRWPFLRISRNLTWDDDLLYGWRIAFGEMLWDEILAVLEKNDEVSTMQIEDVKEKYNELRVYFTCGPKSFEKIDKIIYKYTTLSFYICAECGRPDVGHTKHGWIEALCRDCYEKPFYKKGLQKEEIDKYYAEEMTEPERMPDFARWTSYRNGKSVDHAMWIKDTADEIRTRWEASH